MWLKRILIGAAMVFGPVWPSWSGADLSREAIDKLNRNRVGIVSGQPGLNYIKVANDLAKLLDDPRTLQMRVVVLVGKGSEQNIDDLLHLRNVDIAVVQADVLEFVKQEGRYRDIDRKIGYITKLYDEDVHILARGEIDSVFELEGRRISIGGRGSGTAMTANRFLDFLKIDAQVSQYASDAALSKLIAGDLDAMFVVTGKGADLFRKITESQIRSARLHFLPLPDKHALLDQFYPPSELTAEDYPLLIDGGEPVAVRAVPAVMAAINWKRNVDRRRVVKRFIDRFFAGFDGLSKEGYNENWTQVNLDAKVLGWERLPDAEAWLEEHPNARRRLTKKLVTSKACGFEDFLTGLAKLGVEPTDLTSDKLMLAYKRFNKLC